MWQQSQKPGFSPSSPYSWPFSQPPTGPGASEFPRFVPTHPDRTMSSSDMPHLRRSTQPMVRTQQKHIPEAVAHQSL